MIFTGSPKTVYLDGDKVDMSVLEMGLPILGICYGHQLIHYMLNGEVRKAERIRENLGAAEIRLTADEVVTIDEKLNQMEMSAVFGGSPVKK